MPTPNGKQHASRKGRDNAARRRARREQRQQWIADHGGTPYVGYLDYEPRISDRVVGAMQTRGIDWPTWSKGGKGRKPQRLRVDDLSVGLWAVECVGSKGISYGQLNRCFLECREVGCHNNKAAAIFTTLMALGLIAKIGNYSANRRGNVYRVLRDGETPPPPPPPRTATAPPSSNAAETPPPASDDDPWG